MSSENETAGATAPDSKGSVQQALPPGLPAQCSRMSLLGVEYFHMKTRDGGDLYLTHFGAPFWRLLLPENWHARDWFEAKGERLEGTSMVYKVPTRVVDGTALNLVVKWSRVGEVVPMDTLTINKFIHAEFNSPFEEFSLLTELRKGESGPAGIHIHTQRPLAIYVPSQRLQLWQTGRSEDKINAKIARHPGVEIDILRQYVVLYGWIKGRDAVETAEFFHLEGKRRSEFLALTTSLVIHELWQKGYRVVDMKPAHIILRPGPNHSLLRDRNGQFAYALVDYELLERTPEHEQAVRTANRQLYLKHMARRFEADVAKPLPAHLQAINILGVDYICGRAESTGGMLWVVGKDPDLFNYFLPERWRRTPKEKIVFAQPDLSHAHQGQHQPGVEGLAHGRFPAPADQSRGQQGSRARIRFQQPVRGICLRARTQPERRHDGLSPCDLHDRPQARAEPAGHRRTALCRAGAFAHAGRRPARPQGIRLHHHLGFLERAGRMAGRGRRQLLSRRQCQTGFCQKTRFPGNFLAELVQLKAEKLAHCGFEDLNPKPDHLLISFDPAEKLVMESSDKPEARLCNFELVRRRPANEAASAIPA